MRRTAVPTFLVAVALLGVLALGRAVPGTVAQDDMASLATHPAVGVWLLSDPAFPENLPSLVTFHGDGTLIEVDFDRSVIVGVWDATGGRSMAVTLHNQFGDETEGAYRLTARGIGEVEAGGDAFTATYTVELMLPDGTSTGEFGPGSVEAVRASVEPMGEPVGTLDDLFSMFAEDESESGTPDA